MKPPPYPFAAIVGQTQLKTALLLAAVDWRLGVLLRGDKGAGKTTAARALAELLPVPSPFINLPIGVTEDRLLGGINLSTTLKGEPSLRPGLLSEADGGVLYVDEVNLLPDHLADALLDTAATGINNVEREGFSATHEARFVLLGSMNPEEGSLRPQLLDRFALAVDVSASLEPTERRQVVERRLSYEKDPVAFVNQWKDEQFHIQAQIERARSRLVSILFSQKMLDRISTTVCDLGVRSFRADLAIARASCAQAALLNSDRVLEEHIDTVMPFALVHRVSRPPRSPQAPFRMPNPTAPKADHSSDGPDQAGAKEQLFSSQSVQMQSLPHISDESNAGIVSSGKGGAPGPVIRTKKTEHPRELDIRSSVVQAVSQRGKAELRSEDLYEKIRQPLSGSRFLFLVDSSGSHAVQDRMRLVKGAAMGLIEQSVHRRDEVAVIVFRGAAAEILVEPTTEIETVRNALEYLPTGGRTPLAHALELATQVLTADTFLVLVTDGRANVASRSDDPWRDVLSAAAEIPCLALVIDTELNANPTGKAKEIAEAMRAEYVKLETFQAGEDLSKLLAARMVKHAKLKAF
jgi:magnesium chelatase subunit D